MGACCGPVADEKSQAVDKELREEHQVEKSIKKLLLLGSGGSGKSTFFKQLQLIHTEGFKMQEKMSYKSQISEQIITQMQLLIEKCDEFVERDADEWGHLEIAPASRRIADEIMGKLKPGMEMTKTVANLIETLWKDEAIQHGYELRAKLCVFDSSNYFFDNVQRIAEADYVPTVNDILMVRHRTTGMTEKQFTIQETVFNILDVGGQRSERRKWIHFFDGVTGVVFVASLSCYDEVLYEDENVNVMDETLQVFTETCNSHWFQNTSFILFLNKRDLFEFKVREKQVSIKAATSFRDYSGPPSDVEAATDFIRDVFESKNASDEDREIYSHVTCAHDRDQVENVFNDVQHIIVNKSLAKSGLI